MTGVDLLSVDSSDIDDGLRACVIEAMRYRFEGTSEAPRSLYALVEPYRTTVADD